MAAGMHWSAAWTARAVPPEWDCADLARAVLLAEWGVEVALPSRAGRPAGARGRDAAIGAALSAGWAPVPAGDERDGDLVLMRASGRRRSVGRHVGVWCAPGGRPSALHLMAGMGAPSLHPLAALPRLGLEAAGTHRPRAP